FSGVTSALGTSLALSAAAGWASEEGAAIVGWASYTAALDTVLNGEAVADSGARALQLGVSAALVPAFGWRLSASLGGPVYGRNTLASATVTFNVARMIK